MLDVTLLRGKLDCHPVDPAGSLEYPENGVTLCGCLLHISAEMLDGGRA